MNILKKSLVLLLVLSLGFAVGCGLSKPQEVKAEGNDTLVLEYSQQTPGGTLYCYKDNRFVNTVIVYVLVSYSGNIKNSSVSAVRY